MIYTVTFNPSLDYIVRLNAFHAGEINRVNYEQVLAGGKGINVSIVLKTSVLKARRSAFSRASPARKSRTSCVSSA